MILDIQTFPISSESVNLLVEQFLISQISRYDDSEEEEESKEALPWFNNIYKYFAFKNGDTNAGKKQS
jgi:hypothetical protein